jgi:di/tricarboxylate transporter
MDLSAILDKYFGQSSSYRRFMAGMLTKVALLSTFVNNTPVVVLMTPYVFDWGKKHKISPSKLLIPLSYATIVGGMLTIIGTSTTLVLNGFMIDHQLRGLQSLDLLMVGAVVAFCIIVFLILFSNSILPDRKDLIEDFRANQREYLIEKHLSHGSKLIGQTVGDGGLRNLSGIYLVEIARGSEMISPVSPQEVIQRGDTLIFAGINDPLTDLKLEEYGIYYPKLVTENAKEKSRIVEGVISSNSSINGKTVKEADFRERYDAAVVAIHRNGERLSGKIGDIKIRSGDVLLMYAGEQFNNRIDLYKDIFIIAGDQMEIQPQETKKKRLILMAGIALLMLIFQPFTLFASLLVLFVLMSAFRLITVKNIKRDLDMSMVAILVMSIAIGEAMIQSGTGDFLAGWMMELFQPRGMVFTLVGLMLFTTLLTSFITNIGAVAIIFPVAYSLAQSMGIDGAPLYLGVAFAASAAFLTPIGYQTNLIVYGPGGYSFRDFLKLGLPVTIIYLSTAIAMILAIYGEVVFAV